MERSQYNVDRRLYSDEVVARAAHRYTAQINTALEIHGESLAVIFWVAEGQSLPSGLTEQFSRDLLDERLRASVRAETAGLQQELIRAALLHGQPLVGDDVAL